MGKLRIQVNLPEDLVRRIDALVGLHKRSEFIEQAVKLKLRQDAIRRWKEIAQHFRGLTLEDIHHPSREELEARGG